MKQAVLPLAYLAPVEYFSILAGCDSVLIEQYDSYHKQTYRNRCRILGANGPQDLIIPVVKNSGVKTLVKDVEIDYSTRWQANHWRSLFSAYNSSPFFEFYTDEFCLFYEKKWRFLADFNMQFLELICELTGIESKIELTTDFIANYNEIPDYRFTITPKNIISEQVSDIRFERYQQTFGDKFGFVPNLSIADLLFNEGPRSETVIKKANK